MNHERFYANLIQKAPFGYAAHKLVLDETGTPEQPHVLDSNHTPSNSALPIGTVLGNTFAK